MARTQYLNVAVCCLAIAMTVFLVIVIQLAVPQETIEGGVKEFLSGLRASIASVSRQ